MAVTLSISAKLAGLQAIKNRLLVNPAQTSSRNLKSHRHFRVNACERTTRPFGPRLSGLFHVEQRDAIPGVMNMHPVEVDEDTFGKALEKGADRLGIDLPDDGLTRLKLHWRKVVLWSSKMNLTAISNPIDMAELLYLDSACLLPLLDRNAFLHDVGTGAGFPGLVLKAISPDLQVRLSESRGKKVVFLKQTAFEMGLKSGLEIRHARIGDQEVSERSLWTDVVSKAAFPPITWMDIGSRLVAPGGNLWLFFNHKLEGRSGWSYHTPAEFKFHFVHHYSLPFCRKERSLICLRKI